MGRTGVCWDGSVADPFFAALKNGLCYRTAFATRHSAGRAMVEYIEAFYNRIRLHSASATEHRTKSEPSTSRITHSPRESRECGCPLRAHQTIDHGGSFTKPPGAGVKAGRRPPEGPRP
jgi:Integrase core domain